MAETFLTNTGLLDTSSLSAYNYSKLVDTLIYGSSSQFEKAAQGIGKGMKFASTEDWEIQMLAAADNQTSALTDIEQNLDLMARYDMDLFRQTGSMQAAMTEYGTGPGWSPSPSNSMGNY